MRNRRNLILAICVFLSLALSGNAHANGRIAIAEWIARYFVAIKPHPVTELPFVGIGAAISSSNIPSVSYNFPNDRVVPSHIMGATSTLSIFGSSKDNPITSYIDDGMKINIQFYCSEYKSLKDIGSHKIMKDVREISSRFFKDSYYVNDASQEAMLNILKACRSILEYSKNTSYYVTGIIKNTMINYYNKNIKSIGIEVPYDEEFNSHTFHNPEISYLNRISIYNSIVKIVTSEEEKKIIEGILNDVSYADIAKNLGLEYNNLIYKKNILMSKLKSILS